MLAADDEGWRALSNEWEEKGGSEKEKFKIMDGEIQNLCVDEVRGEEETSLSVWKIKKKIRDGMKMRKSCRM